MGLTFAKNIPMMRLLLAGLLCSLSISVLAQNTQLSDVVVTASMLPQQEKETGRNIVSIKGSSLQNLPISSIDELLKYLPGIETQQRGPAGTQSNIIIRGGTFQQVLVIIDGIRINDPLTGHFNSYIPLHPEDINRIEIIKGAASAIYGSDAIGGVVNIITNGLQQKNNHKLSVGSKWGSYNSRSNNFWWGAQKEKWKLSVSSQQNKADGENLRGTTSYYNNSFYAANFNYAFASNWKLHVLYANDSRDFNAQNFYTTFKSDTASEIVKSNWTQMGLSKQYTHKIVKFDVAYKNLSDRFRFNPAGSCNENKTSLFVAQGSVQFTRNLNHQIVTGAQWIHKKIRSNDRGNHELAHGAAFLIATHKLPKNIFINESLRIDWDQSYGWIIIPQVNASWVNGNLTTRASIGKGVRDADFTERYNNYNKSLVTGGSIGNPFLQAEKSWSYELGADYRMGSNFKWGATAFLRNQNNLIDWTPTPYPMMPRQSNLVTTGNYSLATNVSSVKTKGIETDLTYNKKWGEDYELNLSTGLVWLSSTSPNKTPSFYISSHARFLWNKQIVFRADHLQLSINSVYKIRNAQTASAINAALSTNYFLVNSKFSYLTSKRKGNVFLEITNLTNTPYSDLLGAIMPSRWIAAGFQLNL
ncbi:MAG: TonB-dependent receptor plug domain-containing protein [Sediminibacterium sp.]